MLKNRGTPHPPSLNSVLNSAYGGLLGLLAQREALEKRMRNLGWTEPAIDLGLDMIVSAAQVTDQVRRKTAVKWNPDQGETE